MPTANPTPFVLITDSPCDLPLPYLKEHDVTVLHFTYTESGKPDGGLHGVDDLFESRSAHEFYDAIRGGAEPMTSQPSPAEFEHVFRDSLATGLPVVYLCFSSGISGCYEGALAVERRLRDELGEDIPLTIVDTRHASTSQALFITQAVRLREGGMGAEELVAWAREAIAYDHLVFMVDDLTALARGGRIPPAAAKLGSLLGVKPILTIELDGKLGMTGVARGRKKALRKFADIFKETHESDRYHNIVTIGNADCPEDVPMLEQMLREVDPGIEIVSTNVGPTIGCHVGPGMMAIAYWGVDRRDGKQE